ncbi:glycosyltransferase family 2 protein [Xylanimonas ulmi]|uniref:Undecaprenyl-phosphate 4-deoxy-4-formamido-L-arabinose transferase n=1 Tax=Xylanimonas ulmi TaxID=228973 RepID=A0A4Q7LYZ4_9MICO|nr:glycosyltransferase family 2 protein [Xylanibacterium ulmi]RZS59951.1 undecaprenyl-phosphate 4-deoxy-4-formamido-L-arabinose transferase [Xylanibacterium ulmi]
MISFVIPCYCSALTIVDVVDELDETMRRAQLEHEVILVDDCSPDDTLTHLRSLAAARPHITVLALARNFGQHSALMAGLRHASGDVVVCLDDDGQTPPREVTKILQRLDEGFDVVYGRYDQKEHTALRNVGSALNEQMARALLGKPRGLYLSSFFGARRYVIDEVARYTSPYPYIIGLILRTTRSIANVTVEHKARAVGRSGYSLRKLISLWLNGFTAFSVRPLRVSAVLGVAVAACGIVYGGVTAIRAIISPSAPPGWSSLMVALLVLGGLILSALGLVGEYLGRAYISISQAPQFVIKEQINAESTTPPDPSSPADGSP